MADTFFRIVRNAKPTVDDFRTAREEGRPLVNTKYQREWTEGLSVYNSLDYALKRVRVNTTNLGRFVAILAIPTDGSIEVRQTSRDRRHYTIYASGQRVLNLVQDTIVALDQDVNDG